ncbi:MAG: acetoacetate--CoA ligase [Bdellovibrionales bacterium]|nr:acetoacetate--CoA ligase [Bdellovibrionales bacterium]
MDTPLWSPSAERCEQANLTKFLSYIRRNYQQPVESVDELYRWSVEAPEEFWQSMWDFAGIQCSRPPAVVLERGEHMLDARWFRGTRLNFAENLLRFQDERNALVSWNEAGERRTISYAELTQQVQSLAAFLRGRGVRAGDRVAGFLPNIPETVIAMLAAASIGAIWSSCSPDFGFKGVMDRFGQIAPKVLFAADGYRYNQKPIDCLERVRQVGAAIPAIETIVICPFLTPDADPSDIPNAVSFAEALAEGKPNAVKTFEQLPFDHPLYIMYSSGTTGVPKCIVHGAGGTLLQHAKEHILHTDLKPFDVFFYFTTCGWMMWNWLVSGLFSGATLVLYDGAPLARDGAILFDLAEQEGISIFGTSAKFLSAIEKAGLEPRRSHDLTALRAILSTGSTLLPESFDYVYNSIKEDVHLASISGGTDIISCFLLGNPLGPVHRSELQMRGLGMAVEIFDEAGNSVHGERGELVCTAPFPSMPVEFWNDPEKQRYREAYFEHFDNVWRHGDWAEHTSNGGFIVYGRSDATLNPGGVRIGTAEIYRQVEQLDAILESIVVGQSWDSDERVVLFVKLRDGLTLDDELKTAIRKHIRENTTPRHVPAVILQVTDIPRTISGKITELAVKNIIEGREVKNTDAMANPQALEQFRNRPELQA